MGSLIIAGHIAAAGMDRIDRVATIAGPFRGSLEAVATTTTGASSLSAGSTREREAARVTPSLYHLLPTFTGAVTNGMTDDLFNSTKWQTSILETLDAFIGRHQLPRDVPTDATILLSSLLEPARRHRISIEALTLPDPKRWLCIAGIGEDTRVSMNIDIGPDGPVFNVADEVNDYQSGQTANPDNVRTGDGTVPYLGAQSGFMNPKQIVCVTPKDYAFFEIKDRILNSVGLHANLPNMNLVQRLVATHFLQRKQGKLGGRPGPDITEDEWDPPISKDWLRNV
jgi:hypothetical protein